MIRFLNAKQVPAAEIRRQLGESVEVVMGRQPRGKIVCRIPQQAVTISDAARCGRPKTAGAAGN